MFNSELFELQVKSAVMRDSSRRAEIKPHRIEKAIQEAIIKRLKEDFDEVAWVMTVNPGLTVYGRKSVAAGTSDIIGQMKDGTFLAIEVKVPGKSVTDIQKKFLQTVKDNGGTAFMCDDERKLETLLRK